MRQQDPTPKSKSCDRRRRAAALAVDHVRATEDVAAAFAGLDAVTAPRVAPVGRRVQAPALGWDGPGAQLAAGVAARPRARRRRSLRALPHPVPCSNPTQPNPRATMSYTDDLFTQQGRESKE